LLSDSINLHYFLKKKKEISGILNQRNVFIAIIICLASVALIYGFEIQANEGQFTTLNWTTTAILYLALGLLMMVFRDLAYIVRIRILTEGQLSWRRAFNVILLWEFASAITPGVVGGSAAALFLLQNEKIPLGKSTAFVFITLILYTLFYIIFIPLTFLVVAENDIFHAVLYWFSTF